MLACDPREADYEILQRSGGSDCPLTGFQSDIMWMKNKPNQQSRPCLQVNPAEGEFIFHSRTSYEEGLHRTIE